MTKKFKKTIIYTFIILTILIAYYLLQLNWISVTNETVRLKNLPADFDGFKIVHLTDLHNKEFGNENKNLIKKINKIKPDIIVITGDMLTNTRDIPNNGDVLIKLIENLNKAYPIYYVTGEHEEGLYYEDRNKYQKEGTKETYEEKLKNLGVTVLNNEKVFVKSQNAKINIYGLKDELSGNIQIEKRLGKVNDHEVNILLSHSPRHFKEYADWGADLVFTGDTHGGMIRLPFIGGIISREEFFPEYDGGLYHKENSKMIVSRGLGNYPIPLRINNRPEIFVVTLKKK